MQKPAPSAKPAEQPVVHAAEQPEPAPAPKPAAPSIPKMPSTGLGWGPKNKVVEKTPEVKEQKSEESNSPFTADQLIDAWAGLSRSLKDEPRLVQLIEEYSPRLLSPEEAEIQMPNPWQLEEMRKALPALVEQLHKELHNSRLSVKATLAEFSQEQLAVTAEEKYKLMTEANPYLNELKDQLSLQID